MAEQSGQTSQVPITGFYQGMLYYYSDIIYPLEKEYQFNYFHSPPMTKADFQHSKPIVLLLGQYSTGKTTFIRWIVGSDFPGARIGVEPTTDRFSLVEYGDQDTVLPGNSICIDRSKPWHTLNAYGNTFLGKFQACQTPNVVLEHLTFVDTPGVLSGEKQYIDRGYDFNRVVEFFSDRSDRILIIFDAHKLDISDEFKHVIESLRNHDEKLRIVLNKADRMRHAQLMKVYGALMWNLGRLIDTPEAVRVYIGSFWNEPFVYDDNKKYFEMEQQELLRDLNDVPRLHALRRLNDLVKRCRCVKIHALLMTLIAKALPSGFLTATQTHEGEKKPCQSCVDDIKGELIKKMKEFYHKLQEDYGISQGDFPVITHFTEKLRKFDISAVKKVDKDALHKMEKLINKDLEQLSPFVKSEEAKAPRVITGGAFNSIHRNALSSDALTGFAYGSDRPGDWVVEKSSKYALEKYEELSSRGELCNKMVPPSSAKMELQKFKLPSHVLKRVWDLADCDRDGMLDKKEWCLACYICKLSEEGCELPNTLPTHLVPPDKRVGEQSRKSGKRRGGSSRSRK